MLFSFIPTSSDSGVMEDHHQGCKCAKRKRKVSFESEHLCNGYFYSSCLTMRPFCWKFILGYRRVKLWGVWFVKPGVYRPQVHEPCVLKLLWFTCQFMSLCVCVCVCVCSPLKVLIASGMMWCDIDHVWLVKQVLQTAFSCFIWQLPSVKWMGMALLTQHLVNPCQMILKCCSTSYKRITRKEEHFGYKGE